MHSINLARSTAINRSQTMPISTPRNSPQMQLFSTPRRETQETASIGFFGRQEINIHIDSALSQIHSILNKSERGNIDQNQQIILYAKFENIYNRLSTHPNKDTIPGSVIADIYSTAIKCINNSTNYASETFKISCDITTLIMDEFSTKIEVNYHRKQIPQNLYLFSMRLNSAHIQSLLLKNPTSVYNNPINKIFLKIISFHMKMSAINNVSLKSNLHASFVEYQPFLKQFSPVINPVTGTITPLTALANDIVVLIQDILNTAILFANDLINIGNDLMYLENSMLSGFISMLLKLFSPFGITLGNRNHRTGLPILPRFHSPFHFYSHLFPHLYPHFQGHEHILIEQLNPHLAQEHANDADFENLLSLQLSLFKQAPKTTHKTIARKLFQEMDEFQNFYTLLKGSTEFGFVYDSEKIESLVKKTFHHMSIGMTENQFAVTQNFIALLDNMDSMRANINTDIVDTMYFLSMAVLTEETGFFSGKKILSQKVKFSIFVLKMLLNSQNPVVRAVLTSERRKAIHEISMKHHIAELHEIFL